LLGRLRKIDRKGIRAGLRNLQLVRIEAAYLLEHLLPPHSIRALHVYFPDPWPKRKHLRHRLVNERFPELASKVLSSGGVVYLRTDHASYMAQMTEVFEAHRGFRTIPTPDELCRIHTDFEVDFLASGVETRHAAYARS
jgi:tRNA (guanine-N7-)-methyltransferase